MENEFSFIKNKLRPLSFGKKEARELSDDCALFPNINNAVISVDSSIEGVHIPFGTDIDIQARRSVLRALSDLATFGATPLSIFSSINIPNSFKNKDLDKIAYGFRKALIEHDIFLAGGDTTLYSGPLICTITVLGDNGGIKSGRNGAKQGDLIIVSGEIGDSFIGLQLLQKNNTQYNFNEDKALINKFLIPNPRIDVGKKIVNYATSIIDISDGLLADLNHICKNSNVGAEVYIKDIPFSRGAQNYIDSKIFDHISLITGGDDYELLYTIDPKDINKIDNNSVIIGKITDNEGLRLFSINNKLLDTSEKTMGYKHF
jgi:thiamine-monophosphate kinase